MRVLFQLRNYTDFFFFPLLMTKHSTIQYNNWNSWREIHTRTFLPTGKPVFTLCFVRASLKEVQQGKYHGWAYVQTLKWKKPLKRIPFHSYIRQEYEHNHMRSHWGLQKQKQYHMVSKWSKSSVLIRKNNDMIWVTPTKFINNTPTKF